MNLFRHSEAGKHGTMPGVIRRTENKLVTTCLNIKDDKMNHHQIVFFLDTTMCLCVCVG